MNHLKTVFTGGVLLALVTSLGRVVSLSVGARTWAVRLPGRLRLLRARGIW